MHKAVFLCLALLSVTSGALVSNKVQAQESADQLSLAKDRFHEANLAHARGAHAEAARLFEEAYRLAPRAQALFNAAVAWLSAGEPGRAADAFENAIKMGGLEEANLSQARQELAVLKLKLGYLSITEPVGGKASVAHLEAVPIPLTVHLVAGTYLVRAEAPDGRRTSKRVTISARESQLLDLRGALPAAPLEPAPSPKDAKAEAPGQLQSSANQAPKEVPAAALQPSPDGGASFERSKTYGTILVATSVALAGSALWVGSRFLDAREAWNESERIDLQDEKRAQNLRLWTNLLWAGALASGGTGVYLLATPRVEF